MSGIWIALIAVGAAAFLAFAFFLVRSVKQKRAQLDAFLAAPEPQFKTFEKPKHFEYSTECERIINKKFSAYVELYNELIRQSGRLEYLKKKKLAEHYTASDKEEETAAEVAKAEQAVAKLRAEIEGAHWYNYSAKDASGNIEILFRDFLEVWEYIPADKRPPEPMRSFAPKGKKWIQSSDDIWIMPSEFYILVWNQKDMAIRLYDYAELSVKSDFKIKSLGYGVSPDEDDEIAAKHYKHEIASGKPDKKYQNNPMRVEVFRGFISITVGKNRAKVDFKNKKYAVLTEKRINSYKKSIGAKPMRRFIDYLNRTNLLAFRISDIESRMPTEEEEREAIRAAKEEARERVRRERELAKAEAAEAKRAEREKERAAAKAATAVAAESAPQAEEGIAPTAKKSEAEMIAETLTKEEIELIRKKRRKNAAAEDSAEREAKEAEKRAMIRALPEAPVIQLTGNRIITSSSFAINYQIKEGYAHSGVSLKLVDWLGRDVSTEYKIEPVSAGSRIRATFELRSNRNYNSEVPYYMLLTPIGAENPIGKLEYKVKLPSDLDAFAFKNQSAKN